MNSAILIIGIAVGLIASLIAFIVTYDEYSHHYTDRKKPLRFALEAAVFAFCVFLTLSIITGFVLTKAYLSR